MLILGSLSAYFEFLYEMIKQFFGGIWRMISNFFLGIFDMINLSDYFQIFADLKADFGVFGWILAILTFILFIAIFAGLVALVVFLVRREIKIRTTNLKTESMLVELGKLNKQVDRLNKENTKLKMINFAHKGINLSDANEVSNDMSDDMLDSDNQSRFYKLSQIDLQYKDYVKEDEEFNKEINLVEICEMFRNYACSKLHLYYDIRIIRLFVAAMSSTRLIILQGISGTGKTSLPYAWGKFMNNPSQIAPVQPSWRDQTELFGYFNEFTKKFNETEVLKKMYEATFTDKVYLTILDEMNIAKVEYYFAEMLSILEMPSRDEWIVDLVPSGWKNDPKNVVNGRFKLPTNMWYVGTANNDDSTFAISDKVYDRAIPINIDSKGVAFEAPDTDNLALSASHLESLFNIAKEEHKVSEDTLKKLEILDDYVILHLRLAFGNRIVKQLAEFIPCYVACGGTELDGLDYVLANKIFRKFEGMNIAFIRDELDGLIDELHILFGEDSMSESVAYIKRLQKL